MRIQMDRRFIAVVGVLVLAGLALAFAFAFIVGGESGRTEDIWLVQNTQFGSETIPKIVTENDTSPRPVVTVDFSNASKTTIKVKMIAHNQSAIMISTGGKPGIVEIENNPDTEPGTFTGEQRKLAEKIALADASVQAIVGAGMYTVDIQPLDRIRVKDSEEVTPNGTGASVSFTIVNTTTAENETTFFVHVDLDKEKVIRVSPQFPVRM